MESTHPLHDDGKFHPEGVDFGPPFKVENPINLFYYDA